MSCCTGIFVGLRTFNGTDKKDEEINLTLCLTPTKQYPSVFGAKLLNDSSSSIIHGTYNDTSRQVSMKEFVNGILICSYESKLIIDKSNNKYYLHGKWKSSIDSNQFGDFSIVCEKDNPLEILSGIWIGQSDPAEELADFCLPINPIRWCLTMFRRQDADWKLFGSGYFNDSADIPNEPLLFFSLNGSGNFNEMNLIKKYSKTDYYVEYQGKFVRDSEQNLRFEGQWKNPLAGSYGNFFCKQIQLNPFQSYRLDICICEVCRNMIYPGETRWACFQCHFSTCFGCHLNSLAINHQHSLTIHILPSQKIAHGDTCRQLIENAFQLFHSSPLITYRNHLQTTTNQLVSITYGEMARKCKALAKYWQTYIPIADDQHRPFILFIAHTSPALICSLLAGLLIQSVIVPINGALNIDAIKHVLSTTNPTIVVCGEEYIEKISPLVSNDKIKLFMAIYENEEQFQNITTNDFISITKAIQLGEMSETELNSSCNLSSQTISAVLSTSGSTGYPKGAMFTEELLIPNDTFTLLSPYIRIDYQSFDPVLLLSIMSTIKYGTSRGLTNLKDMWNDIKLIRPTSLGLTPSLWNFLYKNYLNKLNRNLTSIQIEEIENEIRQDLGGRLSIGTTGGGAISPTVFSFIRNKLKIDLVNVYGCRECGNIAKDGIIYPGVELKLLPVKDMPEFDGITQGEICIHSPKLIQGYWSIDKHPSFIDIQGKTFYRTGDIGQLEGNTIKLIDRAGIMIKNSMGEWISPVRIENIIEQLPQISFAFIVGQSDLSYLGVIVCPSQSGSTLNEIDMLQLIRFHCVHCGLHGPEIPQTIFIERNIVWNEENGLMKEKKSRHALLEYYSQVKIDMFSRPLMNQNQENRNQFNEEFIQILETILNRPLKGQINSENTFVEIGADSLAISLLCKIYNERGIYLDSSTIYGHSLNHLQQLLANQHVVYQHITEDINWKVESTLPRHITQLITNSKSVQKKKTNILLTGSTGFLGPILLVELLKQTDENVKVYCIIRARDDQYARQRLQKDLEKCQRNNSVDWKRISCYAGDVSKENLGLPLDHYTQLIEEIGFVYHNASYVNLDMPYKALKQSNVRGTLNTLEFALRCQGKFIYTSSVAALPSGNDAKQDENGWVHITSNEINKKDGYGQTKVVVEKLLKQASDLGVDIVIVRPCTISADTETGYTNLDDFINILLRTQVEMKTIVENTNLKLHMVPVDYCAKIIVVLGFHSDSQGKCFNLYGNPLNISRIYKILFDRLSHIDINKIKQHQWKEFVLNNLSENSRTWPLRDRIASMQFVHDEEPEQEQERVPTKMTQEFLQDKCHLPWLQTTEQDFIKSIDYMIEQNFFPL